MLRLAFLGIVILGGEAIFEDVVHLVNLLGVAIVATGQLLYHLENFLPLVGLRNLTVMLWCWE